MREDLAKYSMSLIQLNKLIYQNKIRNMYLKNYQKGYSFSVQKNDSDEKSRPRHTANSKERTKRDDSLMGYYGQKAGMIRRSIQLNADQMKQASVESS